MLPILLVCSCLCCENAEKRYSDAFNEFTEYSVKNEVYTTYTFELHNMTVLEEWYYLKGMMDAYEIIYHDVK